MKIINPDVIRAAVDKHRDEIIQWIKTLICFPSENRPPNGFEWEAQKYIENECKNLGWDTDVFAPDEVMNIKENPVWLEGRDYSNNRKNVVATW
ncbi:unnamed protein product, partial [marine sediment metagenome]